VRVAVVGLGLIGGSVAAAARRTGAEVTGFDLSDRALAVGLQRRLIDRAAASLAEAVGGAEAVFVAAPVGALPALIAEVLAVAAADCVVSDVGSTKGIVEPLGADGRFVGGHPLAGAETAGVEHARADLFEGAVWYLTPAAATSGRLYERLHRLICAFGARPVAIGPEEHDAMLALVSHLPHVFANVLVEQAAAALAGAEGVFAAGPSFRDATRVAGANTRIWTDIYLANRPALLRVLDGSLERLTAVRELLARGVEAEIAAWNDAAAGCRRSLSGGPSTDAALHELRVPVPNRPGVVAELALALGRAGVNIADLALYPAPDMAEGVVALWIAGDVPARRAAETIEQLGHAVLRP
jgi:prephenate dehydrogenase